MPSLHVELWEIIIITILVKIIFTVHIISIIKIQEPAWQTILGVVRHRQLSKVSTNHTHCHRQTASSLSLRSLSPYFSLFMSEAKGLECQSIYLELACLADYLRIETKETRICCPWNVHGEISLPQNSKYPESLKIPNICNFTKITIDNRQ